MGAANSKTDGYYPNLKHTDTICKFEILGAAEQALRESIDQSGVWVVESQRMKREIKRTV